MRPGRPVSGIERRRFLDNVFVRLAPRVFDFAARGNGGGIENWNFLSALASLAAENHRHRTFRAFLPAARRVAVERAVFSILFERDYRIRNFLYLLRRFRDFRTLAREIRTDAD